MLRGPQSVVPTTARFGGLILGPAAAPLYGLVGGGKGGFYAILYVGAAFSAVSLVVVIAFTSHHAMGAFDVVRGLWLEHLGASMR